MKRDKLLSRLRRHARKKGLAFNVVRSRGKGSHVTVTLGTRRTIVKDGELKPGYIALIVRQLGLKGDVLK